MKSGKPTHWFRPRLQEPAGCCGPLVDGWRDECRTGLRVEVWGTKLSVGALDAGIARRTCKACVVGAAGGCRPQHWRVACALQWRRRALGATRQCSDLKGQANDSTVSRITASMFEMSATYAAVRRAVNQESCEAGDEGQRLRIGNALPGLANRYPWSKSQPSSMSTSRSSTLSIPSATICLPISWQRATIERTIFRLVGVS